MTTFTKLGEINNSIAIRVTDGEVINDYGVFDITKDVCTNPDNEDPEVQPTYEQVEENKFTDYFSDIDTDEKFETACISYLNAEQGYNL